MKRTPLLSVAVSPHIHDGSSVSEIYLHQFFALLPAAVGGLLVWGAGGLRTLLLALGSAVVIEWISGRMMKRETSLANGSILAQGLMLGMLLHASAPIWLIVVAAAIMVVMGKQIFGGLGAYPVNPLMLAMAFLLVSWPARLNLAQQMTNTVKDFPMIEPLVAWRGFGAGAADAYSVPGMLMGQQLSGVGSTAIILLCLGGIYLAIRGFIAWRITVSYLVSMFVVAMLFNLGSSEIYPTPIFHLASGIAVFAAFFIATDFTTAPVNPWAQVIYGAGCGILTILFRTFGIFPDGTVFAIILMNLVNPLVDRICPKVISVEVPVR